MKTKNKNFGEMSKAEQRNHYITHMRISSMLQMFLVFAITGHTAVYAITTRPDIIPAGIITLVFSCVFSISHKRGVINALGSCSACKSSNESVRYTCVSVNNYYYSAEDTKINRLIRNNNVLNFILVVGAMIFGVMSHHQSSLIYAGGYALLLLAEITLSYRYAWVYCIVDKAVRECNCEVAAT